MLHDVTRVYVAQDRETGEFIAVDCMRVKLLRNAARSSDIGMLHEAIACAVLDGELEFINGYDVVSFFVEVGN